MNALCIACGMPGGPFAHAIFMGTALGALFGLVFSSIGAVSGAVPTLSSSSTYAVLGIASVVTAMFKYVILLLCSFIIQSIQHHYVIESLTNISHSLTSCFTLKLQIAYHCSGVSAGIHQEY